MMEISKHPSYKHLKACRQRCNNVNASNYKYYGGRGIKCLLTSSDILFLWIRDNASLIINPSLARENHNLNYTLQNCEFISKTKNVIERNSRILSKRILQYDLNGNFIKEWKSLKEARINLHLGNNGISQTLTGRQKSAYGYIWKYKGV